MRVTKPLIAVSKELYKVEDAIKERFYDQKHIEQLYIFTVFMYLEFSYFVPISINESLFGFLLIYLHLQLFSLNL